MGTRVVEVAPGRHAAWRLRFDANNPGGAPQRVVAVESFDASPLAVLLIRRGGYAVAFVDGDARVAHKVGSRYVQSRTAAGGWSQQRYARRRGNQADALVEAVADHFVRILAAGAAAAGPPRALFVGGDKALVAEVLRDPRLGELVGLPVRTGYALPDPNRRVLDEALTRARAVRVTIEE